MIIREGLNCFDELFCGFSLNHSKYIITTMLAGIAEKANCGENFEITSIFHIL